MCRARADNDMISAVTASVELYARVLGHKKLRKRREVRFSMAAQLSKVQNAQQQCVRL
jgi:hypothetical protein